MSELTKGALPYTLDFELMFSGSTCPLPALHAYSAAAFQPGAWLIVGGRIDQGLHKFTTGQPNFIPQDANPFLWLIEPESASATLGFRHHQTALGNRRSVTWDKSAIFVYARSGNW